MTMRFLSGSHSCFFGIHSFVHVQFICLVHSRQILAKLMQFIIACARVRVYRCENTLLPNSIHVLAFK